MKVTPSPYYSKTSFSIFGPLSLLYSLVANLIGRWVLSPTPLPPPNRKLGGQVAIVTGSNTGIGYETARSLALDYDMTVLLACRDIGKARVAQRLIGKNAVVLDVPLDLSDLTSVEDYARHVRLQYPQIHVLVNNAGRNTSGKTTNKNWDLLFTTNFLGHYVLTNELLLNLAPNARIVNLSSVMHHFCGGPCELESKKFWKNVIQYDKTPMDYTYSLSKLAALLFTIQLNQRYVNRLQSVAVNPGAVYSDIWRDYPPFIKKILFRWVYLTPRQGAFPSIAAAVGENAVYLQPYWQPTSDTPHPITEMLGPFNGARVSTPRLPSDGGLAASQSLWDACQEITQVQWPKPSKED